MRNLIYVLLASILVGTSCTSLKEDIPVGDNRIEGNNVLEAVLEKKEDSRTVMSEQTDGVYKTLWSVDDNIGVFIDGNNNMAQYKLISGEGTTTASFKGYGKGESYVALYPASMAEGVKGNILSLQLPNEQHYADKSFGENSFPMVSISENEYLTFKNTCAVLKISMTGTHNIESIVFKANDEKVYVSGTASINLEDYPNPILTMEDGASNEVTLVCNGVALDRRTTTDFHIVLPAQTYKGGFTLTINTSTGYMVKSTAEDVVLERSQIRGLKSFALRLDEGIEPSADLEGRGTESSPFLIQCLEDLILMQGTVNAENGTISPADGSEAVVANTAYYKLTQDISLTDVCGENKGSWTPIGNYAANENYQFYGEFDGDGHIISDLYINNTLEYQGLFGYYNKNAQINNLRVKGNVKGQRYCGLVCGGYEYGVTGGLNNCESHGRVEANSYVGGIIGKGNNIVNCCNYAEVQGNSMCGGITGTSNGIINSINVATIVCTGTYTGGIVGYFNAGRLYNCYNLGKVVGNTKVGGIAGYSRQSSKIHNNYNAGEVTGKDYVAGIVGWCDTYDSAPLATEVKNCINWGTIELDSSAEYVGSICGLNSSTVSYCYWLYDADKKMGMEIGVGVTESRGRTNNCYGLSEAIIKGEDNHHTALYVSSTEQKTYYKVLDALQAWADDNKADGMEFYGWKYSEETGYPILNGRIAETPYDDNLPVFKLSQKEFSMPANGGEISVNVAANMGYYISSMPNWITEKTTESSRIVTEKIHVFQIQENGEEEERQGVIVFCNENEQCIPVTVFQRAKLNDDESWKTKDFWHKSLAMRFTSDGCGYCPEMETLFSETQGMKPDKFEVVHLHCSGGLLFDDTEKLQEQYVDYATPRGVIDGRFRVNNREHTEADIINVMEETEKVYGTETGIGFDSYISNNQLEVYVQLYIKKADKYKITVLLLESGIVGYQNGYGNSYVHNDIARLALSEIKGDEFSVSDNYTRKDFSYKGTIPAVCNKDNLRILVYVQREYGEQTVISTVKERNYYVDNSLSEKVGVKADVKFVE